MNDEYLPESIGDQSQVENVQSVRSLRELIDRVSGKGFQPVNSGGDAGLAEILPFPFLAIVGQMDMKLSLLLGLINPAIGGILLIGPRGTGKSTAARSLVDLLPKVPRSLCHYGCLPEDIESGGLDAVCPDCARKYGEGEPLALMDNVRLIELPLNARLDDVIGGINERAVVHERVRLRRGILAQSDRNILYVDEVNLLADEVVDAILDAAAQGSYTVRRGPISATYRSRFVLIGSMNPEEGRLRPQILDRFGLRVVVQGLADLQDRLSAYRRVQAYIENPRLTVAQYTEDTAIARAEIQAARDLLHQVKLSDEMARMGLELIEKFKIDSLRAELTLFEAARAHAAADGRTDVRAEDLRQTGLMALRFRRSSFMNEYISQQQTEDVEILSLLDKTIKSNQTGEFNHAN
jgi:magnesium chelatase subunit I